MKNEKRKRNILLLLLLFLAFGCIILGVIKIFTDSNKKERVTNIKEDTSTKLPDGQLAIKMNTLLQFESADSYTTANIQNKSNNNYDLYVKIVLEDGEEIYRSTILKPSQMIEEIKLDRTLEKGRYSAIAYFVAVDDKKEKIGQVGAEIIIQIES